MVRGVDVMLLPAGHIFGSAQCFLFAGNETLLYTGDFKLRPGRSAEPAEWRKADTLIMETTFGLSRYRFPPTEQVVDQIVSFCRETIEAGEVPVLLGYSLGKAQEILCSLDGAGLTPMLHGSVYRMTRIYEQFGQSFCKYVRYKANDVAGKVLICPPSANRSQMLEKIARRRVAMISGWAVDPNAVYRYGVDAAFPLSDHADYDDLIRYVELVQPRRVFTLHGFAAEFASDLRARGIEAWALNQENQLEFALRSDKRTRTRELVVTRPSRARAVEHAGPFCEGPPDSEFLAFANIAKAISTTPARLEKIRLLADYLRGLTSEQLPIATLYFTGRAFAQSDLRTLQVGWAIIFRALQAATNIADTELHRIASAHGDAGKSAFEILDRRTTPQPTAKPVCGGVVVAGVADHGPPASEPPATVYLEDKFDGIRAQLHRSSQRIEIFSRDLRRITTRYPELADQARNFQEELILDGEIIAFQKDRRLTFFDLQKRLGRTSNGADLFARAAADGPVAPVIFDLLWLNGHSLLRPPSR